MSRLSSLFFVMLLLVVSTGGALAQSKTELEKQKKQLQKDIEYTNKLLKGHRAKQEEDAFELVLMKAKINHGSTVDQYGCEPSIIGRTADQDRPVPLSIALEDDLARLKEEYGKMLYYTYKNQSQYDRLMFILSSKDINQAYKRVKYFQQYAKHRQEQVVAISAVQKDLNAQKPRAFWAQARTIAIGRR
jgi:septal ring factor EnvC (AmiA/AmiB activator)